MTDVATQGTRTDDGRTRPLEIDVPQEDLVDVRRRVAATPWPDKGLDRGGHFAAWEQPELFSSELRTASRSLR